MTKKLVAIYGLCIFPSFLVAGPITVWPDRKEKILLEKIAPVVIRLRFDRGEGYDEQLKAAKAEYREQQNKRKKVSAKKNRK